MAKDDSMKGFGKVMPEKGDYDSDDVVNKVQKHLKEHGGAEDDVDLDTTSTPEPEKEPTDDSDSTPKPGDVESADDDDSTSESDAESAAEKDDSGDKKGDEKPAIPDNHYRALVHSGWKPEKISSVYEKDPELLLELAEKAYADVNSLSRQFAQLGRTRIEMEQKLAAQKPSQAQIQTQVQPQQQGPDLAKLREQYEEDPFGATVELLKAFGPQAQQQQQPQQVQPQEQTLSKEQFQEDLALTQQLINFFGDKEMEPYQEFYGSVYDDNGHPFIDTGHLSPGQRTNRQQVLKTADQILAGAAFQDEEMPLQQALSMAHMMVSGPIAKQIARKELTSQVKKKAKGVTLKPSSGTKLKPQRKKDEGKEEKQLEKDTETRIERYKEGKSLR